jgi:hypothetical protein
MVFLGRVFKLLMTYIRASREKRFSNLAHMNLPYAKAATGALPQTLPKAPGPFGNPFFVSIQQVVATCSSMIRSRESLTDGIEWLQPFYAQKKLENDEDLFSREGNGFPKGQGSFGGVWGKAPIGAFA